MQKKKRLDKKFPHFVIFLATSFAIAFLLISIGANSEAETEKQAIMKSLVASGTQYDNGFAVVIDGRVDTERLALVAGMSYDELKTKVGAKNDFVVYFVDDEGSTVPIGSKMCIGSFPAECSECMSSGCM